MSDECVTCPGSTCYDCGEHVHPWDGDHYCEVAAANSAAGRALSFRRLFADPLAKAFRSPQGTIHAPDCKWLIGGEHYFANGWEAIYEDRAFGKTKTCCSPSILVQPKPRALVRRLTGTGWPDGSGRCVRGRLPLWTRGAAR